MGWELKCREQLIGQGYSALRMGCMGVGTSPVSHWWGDGQQPMAHVGPSACIAHSLSKYCMFVESLVMAPTGIYNVHL